MTAIRAKCPSCGDVDLAAKDVTLQLLPSGDRGSYGFTCPECCIQVERPATRKVVALLIAAGVEPIRMDEDEEIPAPALEAEDRSPYPSAAPFTLDDVIAFHFLLQDDIAVAELLALEH